MEELHGIIPAVDGIRRYKDFLKSEYPVCVLMNVHISLLESIFRAAKEKEKKIILHVDRINGLSDDEYGAEYVSQRYRPAAAVSIKPSVIQTLKKNHITSIQRVFLIDSFALKRSADSVANTKPDYVEVLPGVCEAITPLLKEALGERLIAGGLIPDLIYAQKLLQEFSAVTMSIDKM